MAVNIDYLVRLRLKFCKELIDLSLRTGKPHVVGTEVKTPYYGNWKLFCRFYPDRMDLGIILINGEGEKIKQTIKIVEEDSNLRNGSKVYYFLCGGYKSRTLYSDGTGFYSRRSFKHSYHRQRIGHKNRLISPKTEPYRKNGKELYRGQLTPYGKRVQKYEEYENRRELEIARWIIKKF